MSVYTEPIFLAALFFPFLAFLFTLPFMIFQYRKYGSIPFSRIAVLYSFIFYLICAFFLTILPLPERDQVAAMTSPRWQLSPFQFVRDFLEHTKLQLENTATYLSALKQGVFLQPLFNIFLLFPLGVYLRYYFKRNWGQTLLLSFALSLFFEVTQLTGIYGIYPRGYRLFDIDDLFLNTLGGLLGFVCTPLFAFFLPKREEIDKKAFTAGKNVYLLRRGAAALIDFFLLGVLFTLLDFILPNSVRVYDSFLSYLFVFLYFTGFTYLTKGRTLGKAVVKIQVVSQTDAPIRFSQLLRRYFPVYGILPILGWLSRLQPDFSGLADVPISVILSGVLFLSNIALFLYSVFLFFYFLISWLTKKQVLFYENHSDTYVISTVQKLKS